MRTRVQAIAAAAALLLPPNLGAQEWSFQSYFGGKPWGAATFRLTQGAPGEYKGQFFSDEGLNECVRREMRATVQQQAAERTVQLHPPMPGCPEIRLVLKNDGSGGRLENRQDDGSWKWDGLERGLKRRK